MRKALLLAALMLAAGVPSVADAQDSSQNFIRDGVGQVLVPFQSVAATAATAPAKAAPAKKARKSKKASKSKAKAKKS
jgi:hypothetical protein